MCRVGFKQFFKGKKNSKLVVSHVVIAILVGLLILIKFPCPFKFVFGFPCPACGTLHALHAAIMLDFKDYMRHNFLAIPMVLAFFLGVHKKSLFKNSRYVDYFVYLVCFLVVIRYILKIFVDFL